MSGLKQISGKDFCKILDKLGFEKTYGRGNVKFPVVRRSVVERKGAM
jgi:predicted RNA binding protein YcfA (HicA-like mRNA interferase family)